MSKFGTIAKTKYKTKTVTEEVRVKSWRAKLAEKLLSKDINELEQHLESQYFENVAEDAERLLRGWWKNYQYELDDEMLSIFPEYQPYLTFQEYKEGEPVDVTGSTYIKRRINGRYFAFIPRFKKRDTPTNTNPITKEREL